MPVLIASAHNGGSSQINLGNSGSVGGNPFLNVVKAGQQWEYNDGSGRVDPTTLDSDMWPLSISHTGYLTTFVTDTQADRPGQWKAVWLGSGTFSVGSSPNFSGTDNGTAVWTPGAGESSMNLVITATTPGNRIHNIAVYHIDDESDYLSGEVWGHQVRKVLRKLRVGVIRFMDTTASLTSNISKWADRKPLTAALYAGSEYRSTKYSGVTTHVGSVYSVAAPSDWTGLVQGATVIVQFDTTTTSFTPTLNVGGTGAVTIVRGDGLALTNVFSVDERPQAGGYATLVYDADLNLWLKRGAALNGANLVDVGLNAGCPPEHCVTLCAELGAHPWFVLPFMSLDPLTDYVIQLATYIRDNGPSWMIPRFEINNETWNTNIIGSADYFEAKGDAHWGTGIGSVSFHNEHGKCASVVGQAVSTVYGNDRTRYEVVNGVQTSFGNTSGNRSTHDPRMTSALYVAQAAPAQSPYTKSAASNWVTAICCDNYWNPTEYGTAQEVTDANAYVAASTQAAKDAIALAYVNTDDGVRSGSLIVENTFYVGWKGWATGFGINKMFGYEGGYSAVFQGGNLITLQRAGKNSLGIYGRTLFNYNNFIAAGGTFPSCFTLGQFPGEEAWDLYLPNIYATPSPEAQAIIDFNNPSKGGRSWIGSF